MLPYLLWNLIAIGIVLARKVGAFLVKGKPLNSICTYFEEQGWIDLFWSCNEWVGRTNWLGDTITNSGPALIPMWYLRDLMVFFILTPLIYWLVKKMKIAFLMILFFCYVSDIWPQIYGLSSNMFFFVLGAYWAINSNSIITELHKTRKWWYTLTFIMLPLMIFYDGRYTYIGNLIYPFFVFSLVPCYINTVSLFMSKGLIKPMPQLSKASFFIFAFHIMILGYCASLMKFIIPTDFWLLASIRYMVTPVVCVMICYICYILMNKFTPRILSILVGGR